MGHGCMDFQTWIEGIGGLASLYAFDILPDGSYSEIRLMAVNRMNVGMLHMNPNAPEFYPGIPYRNYWMDLNFESFVYKAAATGQPLYSYVNARGVWLKGLYIPVLQIENEVSVADILAIKPMTLSAVSSDATRAATEPRTVYCLYIISYSDKAEADSMSQKSTEVAKSIMDLSIRLHETNDFYQAMADTAGEIKKICRAEKCSLYTVDKNSQQCTFINEEGVQKEYLETFASEMNRTPYEVAEAWEADLALSDCLLLDSLEVIRERDPAWYRSLSEHGIRNLILYAIRYNQTLVGFIWAANYDVEQVDQIKETMELSTFLVAAVIYNHQLVSRLEFRSTIDGLTQVGNRNAMNDRVDAFLSGADPLPEKMGIVFADINGLKVVNDQEGHEAGDKLLIRAAALLKIAFGDYEIYRAGGDEFVVFCPNIAEDALDHQVEQHRGLADNTSDVSFAIGTEYCAGSYDIRRGMQNADGKMYRDKAEYYRNHPEKDQRKRGTQNPGN